jgi:hypothetical protein
MLKFSLHKIVLATMVLQFGLVQAQERISTLELPSIVTTTIAEVIVEENENGDLEDAMVYANNDIRAMIVNSNNVSSILDLMEARRNGWEVRLTLEAERDKDLNTTYTIVEVDVLSRENKLSTGLLSTPRAGTQPIIAKDRNEINKMFNSMYHYRSSNYDVNDNCFNRAQYWSRTQQALKEEKGITDARTDKVFIFFSRAYTQKYNHKWWYHVAPVVYQGSLENPIVFDSTFVSRPVTLQGWLQTFDSYTNGQCERIQSLDEFYRKSQEPICMYIVASGFNYIPSDLNRNSQLRNWRCGDFYNVMRDIPAPGAHSTNRRATWQDADFDYLLPSNCRR